MKVFIVRFMDRAGNPGIIKRFAYVATSTMQDAERAARKLCKADETASNVVPILDLAWLGDVPSGDGNEAQSSAPAKREIAL